MKLSITDWRLLYGKSEYPCAVPCSYYDTLLKNGIIDDPYYRDNEKKISERYGDGCRFESEFAVSSDMLGRKIQELVFEGLDTICAVYLNGELLGKTNNMHRTWRFDVRGLIKGGVNTLAIEISSAVDYFKEADRLHPMKGNGDTIAGFAHLRKAFYMSGWDWGPTLPDMGIFRPVYFLACDARITEVELRQKHLADGSVLVSSRTTVEGADGLCVKTVITDKEGREYVGTLCDGVENITVKNPKLWWPNGYGEQYLYTVTVTLSNGEGELDRVTKNIGLRTLTVSQEKDAWGKEFCFIINGKKIFAMGANYIPEEKFLPRRTREKTEYLVRKCRDANFNLLRVWGGGFYPDDSFFELCDEYGLLVWQDFMFACNLVWLTDEMEKTIVAELADNIKRIRHHASLALLCGNNENEEFLCAYMKSSPMELEKADYLRLYCHIIPDACARYAPDVFYWSSSPSSGAPLHDPGSEACGDRHIWTVWSGLKSIDAYKTYFTRFCSEFGFESLPDAETVNGFTLPEDRDLFSPVIERHQKHKNGNGKLMFYMAQYYRYPTEFEKVIYATQLMQARAIRTAVEHFRRNRGRCMGAVYWQLNDCWPVASWSSIDYNGRPKALYYAAKEFFAPVLLSADISDGRARLNISNECQSDFIGSVVLRVKDTSFNLLSEEKINVSVEALSACAVAELSAPRGRMSDTFLEYGLVDVSGEVVSCRTALWVRPKEFAFGSPKLSVDVKKLSDCRFAVGVSADGFVRKLKLSFGDIAVEDVSRQYFDITDENSVYTDIVTADTVSEEEIKAAVRIISEADIS